VSIRKLLNPVFIQKKFLIRIFFVFLFFILPQYSQASALLPGSISSCGELGIAGEYTLESDVVATGASTCFVVSSNNVVINGKNHTITGGGTTTGAIAIDARARDGGPTSLFTVGADGYTNLSVNNLTMSGFTTGIDTSGNSDTTGLGIKGGNGGDGGDVSIYFATVGSVTTRGGDSSTRDYGGKGGNLYFTSVDLNLSNSILSLGGGLGVIGRYVDGGLGIVYSGILSKVGIILSSLSFFNENAISYGVYPGGTWPMMPGNISSCGTLYSSAATSVFTITQDLTSSSTCFTIAGNNIFIDGAGHSITSTDASTTAPAITSGSFSDFTLASTTVAGYSNLIYSSSSVTISKTNLDISNQYILAGSLSLNYRGIFNYSSTTISNLTDINVNGTDYGSLSAGLLSALETKWNLNTLTGSFRGIVSSADGMKVVAVVQGGYIYTSTDSGLTWVQRASAGWHYWHSVASSADGKKLVAVAGGWNGSDYIYTSTDFGVTWTTNTSAGFRGWIFVTSDVSGTKLVAEAYNGYLYTSTDSGATWIERTSFGAHSWSKIVSSADGTKLATESNGGYIYTSTDSGVSWATSTGAGIRTWRSISSSADGMKLAAAVTGSGYIYTSIDGGINWATSTNSGLRSWDAVTSSVDGTKLAAVVWPSGYIYTSEDGGATWVENTLGIIHQWNFITASADRTKIYADDGANIYTKNVFPKYFSLDILSTVLNYTATGWSPYVSWGSAKTCSYSYDNFVTTSNADCSLVGTDILPPASYGTSTLSVKGVDASGTEIRKDSTFNYSSPTSLSACGTLYNPGTYVLSQDITGVSGTCFNIASSNITINGDGHSITSASSSNTQFAINAGMYSGFTLASTTVVGFANFITSSSSVSVVSNGNLDLSNKYINVGSLSISYHGVLNTASTTLSALSSLVVNGVNYGAISAGAFPDGVWRVAGIKTDWTGYASSKDGMKTFMVSFSGYLLTSTDGGLTWVTRYGQGGGRVFRGAASSADGTKLVAVTQGGQVWTSNDSGNSWTIQPSAPNKVWYGVASDASGLKLAAIEQSGYVYTSIDGGVTWAQQLSSGARGWYQGGITSSSDGTKLAAVDGTGGNIYFSIDSGVTWATSTYAGTGTGWKSITTSADGTKLAAVAYGGYIWTSTNSGATWTPADGTNGTTNTFGHNWYSIVSSADGTRILAGTNGEVAWISTDSGLTWTPFSSLPNEYYQFLVSSADGNKFGSNGYLNNDTYTAVDPKLKVDFITPINGSVVTKWSPYISWGTAVSCQYSWINSTSTWITSVCANNGSDISVPPVGTSTLYIRGTDANGISVVKSSTFRRDLNVIINSPVQGSSLRTWSPSVSWNFANVATSTLTCTYSYDNFLTHATSSCALGGSDILPPVTEGNNTLYVKVVDSTGNVAVSNNSFITGWFRFFNSGYNWNGLSSDASGNKLIAGVSGGYIYSSINTGLTWVARSINGTQNWSNFSSSADGTKIVAIAGGNYIYTSGDSGVNWVRQDSAGARSWQDVVSSADGRNISAVVNGGYIYTSNDYGATWATSTGAGSRSWNSIASDSSGKKIYAIEIPSWGNGTIWSSQNGGATWVQVSSSTGRYFTMIRSSSDGVKLVAAGWSGSIWTSINSGSTWTQIPNTSGQQWNSLASSADGSKLSVGAWGGSIYVSSDSGLTWVLSPNTSGGNWNRLAMSADGNTLFGQSQNSAMWVDSSLNPTLKVNILIPSATSTITKWNPYISWGTATVCQYSWNNWTTTNTADCTKNGADIGTPSFGTSTLSVRGTDKNNTIVNKSTTFSFIYYAWYSTGDTDWNNISNWYTDITHITHAPNLPTTDIGTVLVGTTSPIVNLDTWVEPTSINASGLTGGANSTGVVFVSSAGKCLNSDLTGNAVFNGNSCDSGRISGNVIFNDSSYNGGGNISGNVNLNTTYYGTQASSTLTLTGHAIWSGTIGGSIIGSDNSTIDTFIFNNSSSNNTTITSATTTIFNNAASNNGTINGDATFNDTFTFSMGTVNGTSTLNGLSQTLNGVNNVINFIKQMAGSVRDTLYFTSGSVLNISGFSTILGSDANNLLTIRSTTPNSPASIGFSGTSTLDFLRIKDIYNTGSAIDLTNKTAYNDGGNSGFIFKAGATLSQLGGLASSYTAPARYVAPAPASSPSANSNNKNTNNNAGASGSVDPYFAGLVTANVGKLNLSNLPNINLSGIENNLGVSKFVNPLAGMVKLAPVGKFTLLPKVDLLTRFNNFLNGSLPKSLADLSNSVPAIKRAMAASGIVNGYDLYIMKESPINTPTLSDLVKDKTKQPESLIFASQNGTQVSTKLMIDKKGSVYQIITVEPNAVIDINVKNSDKTLPKASWNNADAKVVKDKQNIIKLSVVAPKDIGSYTLKVGALTLQVKVVKQVAGVNNGGVGIGANGGTSPNTQPKKLSPIQKLWSWFGK